MWLSSGTCCAESIFLAGVAATTLITAPALAADGNASNDTARIGSNANDMKQQQKDKADASPGASSNIATELGDLSAQSGGSQKEGKGKSMSN